MQWESHTIFSVISGAVLIAAALLPGATLSSRAWCLVGGAGLIVYGFYVAAQTTGTFYFPVWIYIIPFGAAIYMAIHAWETMSNKQSAAPGIPPTGGQDSGPQTPVS